MSRGHGTLHLAHLCTYVMLLLLCQTSVSRPCLCPRPLATPTHHEPISISTPVVNM